MSTNTTPQTVPQPPEDAHPLLHAIFGDGGLQGVANAGIDAAKTLASLPRTLLTLPTDFLKSPETFISPSGHADFAAILSPEYRKLKEADQASQEAVKKMVLNHDAVQFAKSIFQPGTGSPAELKNRAIAAGVPKDIAEQEQQNMYARGQANQQAATALQTPIAQGGAGIAPEVANMLTSGNPALEGAAKVTLQQQAAARREQAAQERQNRAFAFRAANAGGGGTIDERQGAQSAASLQDAIDAGGIPQYLVPAAKSAIKNKDYRSVAEINKAYLASLTPANQAPLVNGAAFMQTPEFAKLPADQQQLFSSAVASGNTKYVSTILGEIGKNGLEAGSKLMASPTFKAATDSINAAHDAVASVASTSEAAADPTNPGQIDPRLFDPTWAFEVRNGIRTPESLVASISDPDLAARKQDLQTKATLSFSNFVKAQSGKTFSERELKMYQGAWVTGNEPTAAMFEAKRAAIVDAMTRLAEIADKRATAIADLQKSGNTDAYLKTMVSGLDSQENQVRRHLLGRLNKADADPALLPTTISPQDAADAARFGIPVPK